MSEDPRLEVVKQWLTRRFYSPEAASMVAPALLAAIDAADPLRQPVTDAAVEAVDAWIPQGGPTRHAFYSDMRAALTAALAALDAQRGAAVAPIPMVLHCPNCHLQHIDAPAPGWDNPPHRSHLCAECGTIWRPADIATNGVARIATKGSADTLDFRSTPAHPPCPAPALRRPDQPLGPGATQALVATMEYIIANDRLDYRGRSHPLAAYVDGLRDEARAAIRAMGGPDA